MWIDHKFFLDSSFNVRRKFHDRGWFCFFFGCKVGNIGIGNRFKRNILLLCLNFKFSFKHSNDSVQFLSIYRRGTFEYISIYRRRWPWPWSMRLKNYLNFNGIYNHSIAFSFTGGQWTMFSFQSQISNGVLTNFKLFFFFIFLCV